MEALIKNNGIDAHCFLDAAGRSREDSGSIKVYALTEKPNLD